jgi:hypothetical protein
MKDELGYEPTPNEQALHWCDLGLRLFYETDLDEYDQIGEGDCEDCVGHSMRLWQVGRFACCRTCANHRREARWTVAT